jgi:molecular chaperone IbpA
VDGGNPAYPPCNIERTGENAYRISVAVAGFTEKELNIEVKENTLSIRGEKETTEKKEQDEVLYQGIATRAFERRFQLADHVEVRGRASRTVSCMSISCARSPRARSRARLRSAPATPK